MVLKIIGILGLNLLSLFAHGWAVMLLWNWFIVPVTGLIELNIYLAMGIYILYRLFAGLDAYSLDKKRFDVPDISKMALSGILYPALAIFMGWLIQYNMI